MSVSIRKLLLLCPAAAVHGGVFVVVVGSGGADDDTAFYVDCFCWVGCGKKQEDPFWGFHGDLLTLWSGLQATLGMGLAEGLSTFGEETLALQVLVTFLQVRG